jgi:hypothetical protein
MDILNKVFMLIMSILMGVLVTSSAFMIKWIRTTDVRLALVESKMDSTDTDAGQQKQLTKHWQLHGWTRDEINKLRFAQGLEPVSWPDLN